MNIVATSIDIEMVDPVDGVVYSTTITIPAYNGVTDWYSYFYEPIVRDTSAVDFNLPAFPAATLNIDINVSSGDAECGALVMGQQYNIGDSQHGANFSIVDYSVKSTDSAGGVTIIPGAHKDVADINVQIETSKFTEIKNQLASIKSLPVVWVAEESISGTHIYGYFRSFNIAITGPTRSTTLLTIEGLT